MEFLYPATFAFGLTLILTSLALVFFPKWKLMDRPYKYGQTRKPIPYYGGLVLFFAFAMSVLLFTEFDKHILGLLVGGAMIMGVGFLDDRYNVNPWIRLLVQLLAGLVIVFSGIGIKSITNPLGGVIALDQYRIPFEIDGIFYHLTLLADVFTVIWVMLLTNTMNFLDGVDGLPSGVTAIAAFVLFLLSTRPEFHHVDQSQMAILSVILFAVCLGFVLFDFYPARILMGDTGSTFLGFTLAVLAIYSGGKIATAFLVLGVPILDVFWVISRRILTGKSPMQGDLGHLHHRFLGIGLSKRQTLAIIYTFCVLFGLVAVYTTSLIKLGLLFGLVILMVIVGSVVLRY